MLPTTTPDVPTVAHRPAARQSRPRSARKPDPLDRYRRHAERWGTEQVFEAAMSDPDLASDPRERVERLAVLARRLANIDPKWRSPLNDPVEDKRRRGCEEQARNALHLVPFLVNIEGHSVETVAALFRISTRSTGKRLRAAEAPECGGDDQSPAPDEIGQQTPRKHGVPDPTFAGCHPNREVDPALNTGALDLERASCGVGV
jgi:hypothetical protein